jgi:hypothetical protein
MPFTVWKKTPRSPDNEIDEFYSFEIDGLDSYLAVGPGNKKKVWHFALIRNSGQIVFQKDTSWKYVADNLSKACYDALRETFERVTETRRLLRVAMDDIIDSRFEPPKKPKIGRRKGS